MPLAFRPALSASLFAAALGLAALGPLVPTAVAADLGNGWTTALDVTLEGSASLRGGLRSGQTLHGQALAKAEWQQAESPGGGVQFRTFASAMTLAGHGPTRHFLGDFLAASNMEGHSSTRLYSWWVEGTLGDWSLRAGALLADDEFTGTQGGGNFFNSAFGWPAFISANTVNTGPAFFVAAPGVRVARTFSDATTWRLGVYDGDTFDSPVGDPEVNRHGVHYQLGGEQGWFAISELTLTPAQSANRYKVGVWLHTAKFDDVRDDTTGRRLAATGGTPFRHSRNYGGYASLERTLAGKDGEAGHVTAFLRGGFAPVDRNSLSWAADTGIAWTGLLPGRGGDITSLGLAHVNFSPRFADHARASDPANPAPDYEHVIELTHSIALSSHFTLQPDLHYIRHPGGSAAQRDAFAFLIRLKASY